MGFSRGSQVHVSVAAARTHTPLQVVGFDPATCIIHRSDQQAQTCDSDTQSAHDEAKHTSVAIGWGTVWAGVGRRRCKRSTILLCCVHRAQYCATQPLE
jgi:hypothetical protein